MSPASPTSPTPQGFSARRGRRAAPPPPLERSSTFLHEEPSTEEAPPGVQLPQTPPSPIIVAVTPTTPVPALVLSPIIVTVTPGTTSPPPPYPVLFQSASALSPTHPASLDRSYAPSDSDSDSESSSSSNTSSFFSSQAITLVDSRSSHAPQPPSGHTVVHEVTLSLQIPPGHNGPLPPINLIFQLNSPTTPPPRSPQELPPPLYSPRRTPTGLAGQQPVDAIPPPPPSSPSSDSDPELSGLTLAFVANHMVEMSDTICEHINTATAVSQEQKAHRAVILSRLAYLEGLVEALRGDLENLARRG
ncbi:hypothetical protein DFH27DRAFT_600194 [Peziza echinospora]|nr:hypothetical protein DFH27DRAFT_600194 [Peziza echinospora]